MNLEIKKISNEKVIVRFASEEIEVCEKSENWNTEGINKFLIKLASKTPNNELINIVYDKNEEDIVYKHIVSLFEEFVNEYNNLNSNKN